MLRVSSCWGKGIACPITFLSKGFAKHHFAECVLAEKALMVPKGLKDGECDIFALHLLVTGTLSNICLDNELIPRHRVARNVMGELINLASIGRGMFTCWRLGCSM